jgi:hypothetical protein
MLREPIASAPECQWPLAPRLFVRRIPVLSRAWRLGRGWREAVALSNGRFDRHRGRCVTCIPGYMGQTPREVSPESAIVSFAAVGLISSSRIRSMLYRIAAHTAWRLRLPPHYRLDFCPDHQEQPTDKQAETNHERANV